MIYIRKDDYLKFESNSRIILHVLFSCIQFICALAILALQITLTVTETCAFRIGIGFWSFGFLICAPISTWIFLCKRNLNSCLITFIIHICSNLFATKVIIISFIVLIQPAEVLCSTSDNYSSSLNISIISVAVALKIFLYGEIILLYLFRRSSREPRILLEHLSN
jgi:hypothetical protein